MVEATQETDNDLIDQTRRGNSAAFGELVRRYQDRLCHTLTQLCGSADEGQDVAQDAFVQAYTRLDGFQQASAFYTWLYRIAFNLAMTRRRRRRSQVSIDERREVGLELVDGSPLPTAGLEEADRARRVQHALAQLSDEHRQVLMLRELEDWSYEDIAATLELPIGTVRSRLHRARLELRDLLKPAIDAGTM